MGEKDTISKKFMRNNERFADLFNFLYHNGEHIIKPDELLQLDTASIAATNKSGKKSEYKQRQRDVVKLLSVMAGEKETFVIFGVENQSEIDYSMPVRCLFMDMMDYVDQIEKIAKKHRAENISQTGAEFISGFHKNDKLYPVVTAVIYWGADKWDGTCSVEEMFDVSNEAYRTAIPKYTLNLVSPHDLTDTDFEKFDTVSRNTEICQEMRRKCCVYLQISDLNTKMERRMLICVKRLKIGQKKAETKVETKA